MERLRNGSKTFLQKLGVSMVSPFFSLNQALRWLSLSPLILMSPGLQGVFSTNLAQLVLRSVSFAKPQFEVPGSMAKEI